MKTVAVLVAMQEELDAILALFENCKKTEFCGMPIYIAEFGSGSELSSASQQEGKIFLFALSGVGRTNTAINATLIAKEYNPDIMLNIGSAGGLKKEQKILDIVIPHEIIGLDIDLTALGFEYGQILGGPASYFADVELHNALLKIARDLSESGDRQIEGSHFSAHEGAVGSSEAFFSKPEQVKETGRRFGGRVVCVEMEAFSVAVVCHRFKIPFAIIRSLSDVPAHGEGNELAFNEFLHRASQTAAKILHSFAVL